MLLRGSRFDPQPLLGGGFGASWISPALRLRAEPAAGVVSAVAVHPGGAMLACADVEGRVRLVALRERADPFLLGRHDDEVWALAFDATGDRLASACNAGMLRCWERGTQRFAVQANEAAVQAVAFHPHQPLLASAGGDGSVKLHDAVSGALLRHFAIDGAALAIAFSPDGRLLAVSDDRWATTLWGLPSGKVRGRLEGGGLTLGFSPDGQHIATGTPNGGLALFDRTTRKQVRPLGRHDLSADAIAFSPDGGHLAIAAPWIGAGAVAVGDGRRAWVVAQSAARATCVAYGADASWVVFGTWQSSLLFCTASSGELLATLTLFDERDWAVVTPPGNYDASPGAEARLSGVLRGCSVPIERLRKTCRRSGLLDERLAARTPLIEPAPQLETPAPPPAWPARTPGTLPAELVVRTKPTHHIECLAFSGDGALLASASRDMNVDVWNVATGTEVRSLRGHRHVVTSLAFAQDGTRLASGARDGTARIWDLLTGATLASFDAGQWDLPMTVGFCDDDRLLVCASDDNAVAVWHIAEQRELRRARLPYPYAGRRALHIRAGLLAQCHGYGSVSLWDLAQGRQVHQWPGHQDTPGALAFSPSGETLAVGCATNQVTVYIGRSKPRKPTKPRPTLAFAVVLWDVRSGKRQAELLGHTANVNTLAFDPGGTRLASAGADGTLRLWDIATGHELARLDVPGVSIRTLAFTPDGSRVACGENSGEFTGRIVLRDLKALAAEPALVLERSIGDVNPVLFLFEGRTLAMAGEDGRLRLWQLHRGGAPQVLEAHRERVFSLSLSPDGKLLASAAWDGSMQVRELATGNMLASFERPGHKLHVVAFDSTGTRIACAGSENKIFILQWPGVTLERTLDDGSGGQRARFDPEHPIGQIHELFALAWSADGKWLATAGLDNRIRLRDAASGQVLREFDGHRSAVFDLAFSPDSRLLASGSVDQTVAVWDVRSGELRHRFEGHAVPGDVEKGTSVDFSPDGTVLASSGTDGSVRLWDLADGTCLAVAEGHAGSIAALRFSLCGAWLACGSNDAAATMWDVRDARHPRKICALYGFADKSWAVIDASGRFDASDGGDLRWLHWTVGTETVSLDQLKDRYYEPGLLPKLLGHDAEPLRDVPALAAVDLCPEIELVSTGRDGLHATLRVHERGGGIGRVELFVNGKEQALAPRAVVDGADSRVQTLEIDLAGHPHLAPGADNRCEVRVFNRAGYLVSRRVNWDVRAPGVAQRAPHFHAVVVGVSHHQEPTLDLAFAAKDAEDIVAALRLAAVGLFGSDRVHIRLLASTPRTAPADGMPTRANIIAALDELKGASPEDVLVVYLSGHGASRGGPDGDYHFLTADARSARLDDPALRAAGTIASTELADAIRACPVRKQVLVLDTCAAARAVERLGAARMVPASQMRALDRMKDRTGLHILAGSAADAVSWESSRYGQGLLTYCLLLGMRGAALDADGVVDVSRLFAFAADLVPEVARDLGGIQRPHLAVPRAGQTFAIGRLTPDDRAAIPLALTKPLVLRSSFTDLRAWRDSAGLALFVNARLRVRSEAGRDATLIYVEAGEGELPDGVFLAGRYTVDAERLALAAGVTRGGELLGEFTLDADVNDLDAFGDAVLHEFERILRTAAPTA